MDQSPIALLAISIFGLGACDSGSNSPEQPDTIDDSACPLNSGWPCACDDIWCDDLSLCYTDGSDERGLCSKRCDDTDDVVPCELNLDFGIEGACLLITDQLATIPDRCVVRCETEGEHRPCPPGSTCQPLGKDKWSACL